MCPFRYCLAGAPCGVGLGKGGGVSVWPFVCRAGVDVRGCWGVEVDITG
jgi:hypothetical protein